MVRLFKCIKDIEEIRSKQIEEIHLEPSCVEANLLMKWSTPDGEYKLNETILSHPRSTWRSGYRGGLLEPFKRLSSLRFDLSHRRAVSFGFLGSNPGVDAFFFFFLLLFSFLFFVAIQVSIRKLVHLLPRCFLRFFSFYAFSSIFSAPIQPVTSRQTRR